ncbi:MAG: acyltransferase family protein [bacterium]
MSNAPERKESYRADIDGLRAVAVISVLLFHARFSRFQGGFAGVDVFFVISGFLITRIILAEIRGGAYSVARFYARRARRILPALYATILVTVVGSLILNPEASREVGKSIIAVALFSSNLLFWRESGYFGPQAHHMPLLHTWSLAVEEQFYLLFPLFLLVVHRFLGDRFGRWIAIAAVGSFVTGLVATRTDPSAAFYLAPTRAWELMIGAFVATDELPRVTNSVARDALAAIGLALVIGAMLLYTPDTAFPGVAAAVPTIGSALLIYTGSGTPTRTGRLLGLGPLTFIGTISYSLYLLHWPVLVFAEEYSIVELTVMQRIAALVLTTVLAATSWRFVEQPFRSRITGSVSSVLGWSVASIAVVVALAAPLYERAIPAMTTTASAAGDVELDSAWTHWLGCKRSAVLDGGQSCRLGSAAARPTFVVWGDSHARSLATSINISATEHRSAGYLAAADACAPLTGIDRKGFLWCSVRTDQVLHNIEVRSDIKMVILAARWAVYPQGRYKSESRDAIMLRDASTNGAWVPSNGALLERGLTRTVHRLLAMGRKVVLVDETPEIGYDVPSAIAIASRTGRDASKLIAPSRAAYEARTVEVRAIFARLASLSGVRVVSVADRLCDRTQCRIVQGGKSLYRDDNHLSTFGSLYTSPVFDAVFQ